MIDKYKKEHYPTALPAHIEAVKETMEIKGFKDIDLISSIGSKTTVSLVHNRKRALTIDMIRNISDLLSLPLEVLIQPYLLDGKQERVNQQFRYAKSALEFGK